MNKSLNTVQYQTLSPRPMTSRIVNDMTIGHMGRVSGTFSNKSNRILRPQEVSRSHNSNSRAGTRSKTSEAHDLNMTGDTGGF